MPPDDLLAADPGFPRLQRLVARVERARELPELGRLLEEILALLDELPRGGHLDRVRLPFQAERVWQKVRAASREAPPAELHRLRVRILKHAQGRDPGGPR